MDDKFRTRHHRSDDPHLAYRVAVTRMLAIPLLTAEARGVARCGGGGCQVVMDQNADHALCCRHANAAPERWGSGTWMGRRHDDVRDIFGNLARDAGFKKGDSVANDRSEELSQQRPADLWVRGEAGARGGPRRGGGEGVEALDGDLLLRDDGGRQGSAAEAHRARDRAFIETAYDVTITATQKSTTGNGPPCGAAAAAGGAGHEVRAAYKAKRDKYSALMNRYKRLNIRNRRFEALAFESSGLAHPKAVQLIKNWEKLVLIRLGPERFAAWQGRRHRTRIAISTTIHYWNSVAIINHVNARDLAVRS